MIQQSRNISDASTEAVSPRFNIFPVTFHWVSVFEKNIREGGSKHGQG